MLTCTYILLLPSILTLTHITLNVNNYLRKSCIYMYKVRHFKTHFSWVSQINVIE